MLDDQDDARQMQQQNSETRRWDLTSHLVRRPIYSGPHHLELRNDGPNVLIVQDGHSQWMESYLSEKVKMRQKQHHVCRSSCQPKSLEEFSKQIIKACQELQCMHDRKTCPTSKRRNGREDKHVSVIGTVRANDAKPKGDRTVFRFMTCAR